jgi:hypothetical protein
MKAIRRVGKPLDRSEPAFIRTQIQDRPSDCLFHGAPSFTEEDSLPILRLARPPIKAQTRPAGAYFRPFSSTLSDCDEIIDDR